MASFTSSSIASFSVLASAGLSIFLVNANAPAADCGSSSEPTITVHLPKLNAPPDEEGTGWNLPNVWAGHPGAGDDSITVPNGRPIYALIVTGYATNAYLDQMLVYNFARHLQTQGAYVHYSWWNNLLAPYMERPLHYSQSHPGGNDDILAFSTASQAANKAVPAEDYQFLVDAKLLLNAIRENNPSAMIIIVGHSMGGGAVAHLGAQADVVIDLLAPIDPVGNRNYPWAGIAPNASDFNWTRWRVTRNKFLGYKSLTWGGIGTGCVPWGPWLKDVNETDNHFLCSGQVYYHNPAAVQFGSNIINLHHRFQKEFLYPFDYQDSYSFGHSKPPGGVTSQSEVSMTPALCGVWPCDDPGGWPIGGGGALCCPAGSGVGWANDGHGEIIGYRGPLPNPVGLGVRLRTSPHCGSCPNQTWPARIYSGGTWSNGNAAQRVANLKALETLAPGVNWTHRPTNPNLCLVSAGLISRFNTMNKPPVADAGGDLFIECNGCDYAAVLLDGSTSFDPDGDSLQYSWTWSLGSASGPIVDVDLPPGVHCVTLEVKDPSGHIDRNSITVTVSDSSASVLPFVSVAEAWKSAAVGYEARAFDEFLPGIPNGTGCLLVSQLEPVTLELTGGNMTVSGHINGEPYCAVTTSATQPAVSDAIILNESAMLTFEFDPPVEAFYTYFGSLAVGKTATMALYDEAGMPVESITSPQSTANSLAAGMGFTSSMPIQRIEITTTEQGPTLAGAFVGLKVGEPSLGTVDLGNYAGPGGSGVIQLDFACTFVGSSCVADLSGSGNVGVPDLLALLAAWGPCADPNDCPADLTGDDTVGVPDLLALLAAWGACPE